MIAAIVLAAGQAVRFGRCKQLIRLGDKMLLEHVLANVNASTVKLNLLVDVHRDRKSAAVIPTNTPDEAISELEHGTIARAAFGDEVVEHYLNYGRTEQRLFDEVVTCWERERLFERG